MNESERQPWARLPEETEKAWGAFCLYRGLPPAARSVVGAYRAYLAPKKSRIIPPKDAAPYFKHWFKEHRWAERSAAFDDHRRAEDLAATRAIREQIAIEGWSALLAIIRLQTGRVGSMDADQVTRWSTSLRGHLEALGLGGSAEMRAMLLRFKQDD